MSILEYQQKITLAGMQVWSYELWTWQNDWEMSLNEWLAYAYNNLINDQYTYDVVLKVGRVMKCSGCHHANE